MNSIDKLENLISSLKKKNSLLLEMLAITKAEANSIEKDDTDSLNKLLTQKNSIIQSIDILDEAFNNEYNALKKELKVGSLEQASELPRDLLAELKKETKGIFELIKEISDIHEANKQKAKEIKNDLATEIKKINNSMQATNAYRGNSQFQGSYFIDKKK